MTVVFTAGVWDILHVGHIRLLERARALGDKLIVGVLTDDAAAAYKPRPLVPFEQRREIIEALRVVDGIEVVEHTNATPVLQRLRPDILVHGSDVHDAWEIGQTWMRENGGQFVVLPYTQDVSSTLLKERIRSSKARVAQ